MRFLEEGKIWPVGAAYPQKVDVRVVAATNRRLSEMVAAGSYRMDLFCRLAVFPLRVPPLRERREDLGLLINFFLGRNPLARERGISKVTAAAMRRLASYHWPGNLRELDNLLRGAVILCRGKAITAADLPPFLFGEQPVAQKPQSLERVINDHINKVLSYTGGHRGRAAEMLGIHRNSLAKKLRELEG